MAMGMRNEEALRAHKAHHLFGTTPNCHFLCMANGTPAGRDLLPKCVYANPASMPCFHISLDVLCD